MKHLLLTTLALLASICMAMADNGLDTNYTYAEPTIVTNSEDLGSNLVNYSFVCNNVQVTVTKGARYTNYFGVNAGENITITTTQPMKAIVVDGYVKQNFEAEATAGDITYVNAEDDAVESEPVLAVTDINATTLTISCVKQLRCYSMSIYFSANPEIDIEGGEEEDDYSFEWEPTDSTHIYVEFDSIEVMDMTDNLGYPCTDLYLISDTYEMDLSVFASSMDDGTILPVGIYPINDSYADNTVMASPGGYDEYDFPSYLITDFEYDQASSSWYYNTVYYLVSGTLEVTTTEKGVKLIIRASSRFGSTIEAHYLNGNDQPNAVDNTPVEQPATKFIREGHLLIKRNGTEYTISGEKLGQ